MDTPTEILVGAARAEIHRQAEEDETEATYTADVTWREDGDELIQVDGVVNLAELCRVVVRTYRLDWR